MPYSRDARPGGTPIDNFKEETVDYFLHRYQNFALTHENHMHEDVVNIAVSIRRGTTLKLLRKDPNHPFKDRLLPDSFYQNAINRIISEFKIKNYFLHIYSDGCPDKPHLYANEKGEITSLKELLPAHYKKASFYMGNRDSDITFCTLQNCVKADIFIGSISGFSDIIQLYRKHKLCLLGGKPKSHDLRFWDQLCKKFQ